VLVVAALGGNALLKRGEPLDAGTQRENARQAAKALATLAVDHTLVVTHGNGPQVGLLALQSEAYSEAAPLPLDVLGAESEGMIGYVLEQELRSALPGRNIATLLTQVEVDPNDPAFRKPTKPIGPVYSETQARALARDRGWAIARESEGGFRRVVASPEPKRILELSTIRLLVAARVIVICGGGGGIPVVADAGGAFHGVQAVIDKDLASALLAAELGADLFLLLTDQPAVFSDWPEPARRPLVEVGPVELRELPLDPGSMGPKAEAACRFVEETGRRAAIGALSDTSRIFQGEAGTNVVTARTSG
jgi:carbamate kinase